MKRRIIQIDESKCTGCGLCVNACHEGAIKLVNGKAKLIRDDYCDGLGDCLPTCPTNAISFIIKDTLKYNEEAVLKAKQKESNKLSNWPIQLKLAPSKADYYNNSNLLLASDCSAFTYSNFHNDFRKNHITLIACPKLDRVDYTDKLTEILLFNNIKSITIVRMEVPCCSSLSYYVNNALKLSNKVIPVKVVVISTEGDILINE